LRKVHDVRIAPSLITIHGKSVGLGLFARTNKPLAPALLAKLKRGGGSAEERKTYAVFKPKRSKKAKKQKENVIGKYEAELMTQDQLNRRYDYKDEDGKTVELTAPYGVTEMLRHGAGKQYDSLCHRNYVSYANDARGSTFTNNADLLPNLVLVPLRVIWEGEEILWDYRAEYWAHDVGEVKHVKRSAKKRASRRPKSSSVRRRRR